MFHSVSTLIGDRLSRNGATVSVPSPQRAASFLPIYRQCQAHPDFFWAGARLYPRIAASILTLDKEKLPGLQPPPPKSCRSSPPRKRR